MIAADLVLDLDSGRHIAYGPAELCADIEAERATGRPQALRVGGRLFVPTATGYECDGQPFTAAEVVALAAKAVGA